VSFRPRSNHPYARAPRIPDEGAVALDSIFPDLGDAPVEIEIGPGRGGFMFERAAARPEARLLGFEIRLKWATLVDERLAALGLASRARVFNGDARVELPRLAPEGRADVIYLHFPDPWWKKRHAKRLVMGPGLLDGIARLLRPGADLYVQTDVEERAQEYEAQVLEHAAFEPHGDAAGSPRMLENPYGARSPREHRAIADGLPVHRLRFARKP
jgi:tRNA (guanine-N7-)-methyltransferase